MNIDTLEQEPCNTCGYEEGGIYCKEHCPHEAKIEQEPVFFPPCQDCNTKMDEIRRAYDKLQESSGDAISRENAIIRISWDFPTLEISKVKESLDKLPSVTPQPSISQPDIEAIRQEIETEMNLCRMKDTVSKGYKGKILEEVLGKIDKYIQKPQEKWIDEDDNRYICKECEYAHKPQKEPCEDAISRQAVRHILNHEVKMPIKVWKKVFELVDDLPPVNPQPKIGHWIWCFGSHKCSNCEKYTCFSHKELLKYCPNCGCRMVEPQERSGEE